MKKLDVSPITNTSRFPFKKGTLQFLQDAHREVFAALIKSLIGPGYSSSVVYVMSGVVNTGTGLTYNVSAGSIFYNGEQYDFDGANFTAVSGNVGVFNIVQSQYTTAADPVTFTDLTTRNVHDILKMQLVSGASGAGLADFSQLFRLSFQIPAQLNLSGTGAATVTGAYPDINVDVPLVGTTNQILAGGSFNIGDVPGGGFGGTVTLEFLGSPVTLPSTDYYVMGTIISNGTASLDTTVAWTIKSRTTTDFVLTVKELAGAAQNIAFEYLVFSKT